MGKTVNGIKKKRQIYGNKFLLIQKNPFINDGAAENVWSAAKDDSGLGKIMIHFHNFPIFADNFEICLPKG